MRKLLAVAAVVLLGVVGFVVYQNVRRAHLRNRNITTMKACRVVAMTLDDHLATGNTLPVLDPGGASRVWPALGLHSPDPFTLVDGWGREVEVMAAGREYAVWSLGSDGRRDDRLMPGAQGDPRSDIVFIPGRAWSYPAGFAAIPGGRPMDPFARVGAEIDRVKRETVPQ